jgi:hypothetical protein
MMGFMMRGADYASAIKSRLEKGKRMKDRLQINISAVSIPPASSPIIIPPRTETSTPSIQYKEESWSLSEPR